MTKRFKIVDEQFISYYGGTGHKISNGECGFWLWHSKEESQKVCDKLNSILDENEQLKQYNQQITKVLEAGGVILTKNQLTSLIEMKNDDSVEVRHLKSANAKLKDEINALKEYIQKNEVIK